MRLKKVLFLCVAASVFMSSVATPVYAAKQPVTSKSFQSGSNRTQTRSFSRSTRKTVSQKQTYYSARGRLTHYQTIQNLLDNKDYDGLRKNVLKGLNINATNHNGDTSLCHAIKKNDTQSFSILRTLGAQENHACMYKIPLEQRQLFVSLYLEEGGSLSLETQEVMSKQPVNWSLWGKIGGSALVAGGVVAVAVGASGGGSGSDSSDGNNGGGDISDPLPPEPTPPIVDSPTDPASYLTPEFNGTALSGYSEVTNFLSAIKANYAYAYAVQNNQPVAGEGITVGVIDSGVNVNHPDLKYNIKRDENGKVVGASFDYGPCRGTNRKNCWFVNEDTLELSFYDNNQQQISYGMLGLGDFLSWVVYDAGFSSDYDWDLQKDNPSPNYTQESLDLETGAEHGTHVAGIIAASKNDSGMHGVAYNAEIVAVNLINGWINLDDDTYNAFKFVVDNGAKVINNSWGIPEVYLTDTLSENLTNWDNYQSTLTPAIRYASIDNDAITLFAAGNDGDYETGEHPQAGIEAAAPMVMPSLLYYKDADGSLKQFTSYPADPSQIAASRFVAVVSLNNDLNDLAYYSQRCGAAANWCIATPGGEVVEFDNQGGIVSTVLGDSYEMLQGTSMATPVVSGALATILGAAPSLKTEEAVAIMFETATDLGQTGVDEVFGHGLLNLERALQPVGTTTLALDNTTTGQQISFAGTRLTLPRTFSASLLKQLPEHMVVLDKYKRGFDISTKNIVRSTTHSKQSFANSLRAFTHQKEIEHFAPSEKLNFSFSQSQSPSASDYLDGVSFGLSYLATDRLSFNFAFEQNAKEGMDGYFNQALKNPFTTSATNVYSVSNTLKLQDKLMLDFALSTGKNNFFDGNSRLDYQHEDSLHSGTVQLTYTPVKSAALKFSTGLLSENDSVLGLNGAGAFDVSDSKTYFMGVQLSAQPIKKLELSASYYYGTSSTASKTNFMKLSDIQSESIAFKAAYSLDKDCVLGFRTESPLYLRKATAEFDLPVARDATEDVVYRKKIKADLTSEAREWDFSVFSTYRIDNWKFQTEAMVRLNPEHQSDVKNDYRLMFSFGFDY